MQLHKFFFLGKKMQADFILILAILLKIKLIGLINRYFPITFIRNTIVKTIN